MPLINYVKFNKYRWNNYSFNYILQKSTTVSDVTSSSDLLEESGFQPMDGLVFTDSLIF
ncbi:MAG: hypothetical protein IPJ39_21815 [Saprospiraceae bacterium]|nr:hypothetical protein [Saprospiraceae bacterium]